MSNIAIKVENVSKKYVIGHQLANGSYVALRDVLMQNARRVWHSTREIVRGSPIVQGDTLEEVWALKDLSFEVKQGEVVGIIGRNGAGKSTLLKVLSRITEPTTGRVHIRGRVASLLEVGTGFHPELTGRENIFLNGAILGMRRDEIRNKFDEIVAFAEIESFLDTPVKRYSSGMNVRLAFAVASHLEAEILLMDEVLAVGDTVFQKKCLAKMGGMANEGRTVLFVSHNLAAVSNLCQSGFVLQQGRLGFSGTTGDAVVKYMQESFNRSGWIGNRCREHRPSWAEPWITSARVFGTRNREQTAFPLCADVTFEITFQSPNGKAIRNPVMGVVINHTVFGAVGNVNTRMTGFKADAKEYRAATMLCTLRRLPFVQGLYTVDLWLGDGPNDIDTLPACLMFSLEATDVYGTGKPPFRDLGVAILYADWEIHSAITCENNRPSI